jgi:lysyl-tRNA synthetase class 2
MLTAEACGEVPLDQWRRLVDIGDHVSVTGEVVTSRRGELSIAATAWLMAAKCLHPLPDKRKGFTDPEARVRQRHIDLVMNPDSLQMMRHRSAAVRALRNGFESRGFIEVETPMLQAVHGGANARPFVTHINAYDTELFLRIAPELFLKRLSVGGMGKIFELNRNFRNEGADATHNPEFTSVEAYQPYADYHVMRELTRELLIETATAVFGKPIVRRPDGEIDISGEWAVITVHDAVSRATGVTIDAGTSAERLRELCAEHGVHTTFEMPAGELVLELYDELVEPTTTLPTFYTDFPLETSPLTRTHRSEPRLAERWDLVAFGAEIGTAYSELVDPVEQRRRLTEQSLKAAAGDPEAMSLDEDFLHALEYAMPPSGGLGIGVDRVLMMLTGQNIRATLAFPFVRPAPRD